MEEVRYSYCVKPRRPIKNVGDISVIRTPKSLQLTLDEVLQCIPCGPVYRRFVAENRVERVTSTNAARLHNEKYMTEAEYEVFCGTESKDNLSTETIIETPESDKAEEATAPVEEYVESQVEESVTENIVDATETESIQETVADEKVDEPVDTSADDVIEVSEEPSIDVVESDSIDDIVANEEEVINNGDEEIPVPLELEDEVVEDSVDGALENVIEEEVEVRPHTTTTIQIHNNNGGKKKKNKNRN